VESVTRWFCQEDSFRECTLGATPLSIIRLHNSILVCTYTTKLLSYRVELNIILLILPCCWLEIKDHTGEPLSETLLLSPSTTKHIFTNPHSLFLRTYNKMQLLSTALVFTIIQSCFCVQRQLEPEQNGQLDMGFVLDFLERQVADATSSI